jgi:hypothetical protein
MMVAMREADDETKPDESQVARSGNIPAELVPIHKLAQRWGRDVPLLIKSMHILERARLSAAGALGDWHENFPPDQWAFQEVFTQADVEVQAIIKLFYQPVHDREGRRQYLQVAEIAARLNMGRSTVFERRKLALAFMLGGVRMRGFSC